MTHYITTRPVAASLTGRLVAVPKRRPLTLTAEQAAALTGTHDDVRATAARAGDAGLFVTYFNSGVRRNEVNGFRVFHGRTKHDHFDAGWMTHCKNLDVLNAFVAGYVEGLAAFHPAKEG